jgi:hypothetical protein
MILFILISLGGMQPQYTYAGQYNTIPTCIQAAKTLGIEQYMCIDYKTGIAEVNKRRN